MMSPERAASHHFGQFSRGNTIKIGSCIHTEIPKGIAWGNDAIVLFAQGWSHCKWQ